MWLRGKRIGAFLLALAIMCTLLPAGALSAFATEDAETEVTGIAQDVQSEFTLESAGLTEESTEPSEEVTEPSEETTEPTEESTEPSEETTEPSEAPAEDDKLAEEDYAQIDLVFDRIDTMEESPAKKNADQTELTEAAIEIVLASDSYVEGSLERSGETFSWWTDSGIRCAYNPKMQEIEKDLTPENAVNEIVNEPDFTKAAPSSRQVYLIGPYYGIDENFTDQYKNTAAAVAGAIGDTDGYTLYSGTAATLDKVAEAMSNGAVVFFDSHGATDYKVGDDWVSGATCSYLCLTSTKGITRADYEDGAAYTRAGLYVNGSNIASRMSKNSPGGILWMAICLGMATDGLYKPMRQKGVEVVYGYSQSVTFGGDYRFSDAFWGEMKNGSTVAESIAVMKNTYGNWDHSYQIAVANGWSSYASTIASARYNYCAFPIVVSDQDTHPGQRTASQYASSGFFGADSLQTVSSTYRLFERQYYSLQNGVLTITGTGALPDYTSASGAPWYQYRNSITSVVIGSGITSVSDYGFYGYPNLTKVDLGSTVKNVGYAAFYGCSALKEVRIPSTVTTIEYGAFGLCSNIQDIYYSGTCTTWAALSNRPTGTTLHCSGHSFGSYTTVQPTYSSGGYTYRTCSRCGYVEYSNYTAPLGMTAPTIKISLSRTGKPALSWQYGVTAKFEIYRSTSKTGTYTRLTTTDSTSLWDTTAVLGKTYYYKIRAVYAYDSSTVSPYSNVVSATAIAETPAVSITNNSSGKPYLSWAKADGAKKYTVYRATSQNGKYSKLGTTTKLYYTDTKAKSGNTYYYKVISNASKSKFNSAYSSALACSVICGTPTLSYKLDSSTAKPNLSWKKADGAVKYAVYRMLPGQSYVLLATVTGTGYNDKSAPADTTCKYYVQALGKTSALNGKASNVVTAVTGIPTPPIDGYVNAISGKPGINWGAVDGAVKYQVYRSTKSSKGYTLLTTTTGTTYIDTTVSAGKTYYYKVRALGNVGKSADSSYVKLTGKCAVPTITADNASSGKPVISWQKVSGAKKYTVYSATSENGKYKKLGTTSGVSYTDTKAKFGTAYYYKVIANGSSSKYNSGYSAAVKAIVKCATPTIKVTLNNAGKPVISWNKVEGAYSYEVRKNGAVLVYTYGTSHTDIDAQPGEKVTYTVRTLHQTAAYYSNVSSEVSVIVSCAAPDVSIRLSANNKPYITWPGVDGGAIYVVYRSTKKTSGYTKIGETYGWGYEDLTAKSGKTYYYKVVAVGPSRNYQSVMSDYVTIKSK